MAGSLKKISDLDQVPFKANLQVPVSDPDIPAGPAKEAKRVDLGDIRPKQIDWDVTAPTIPATAKDGDYLKVTVGGTYGGFDYEVDDAAYVIDATSGALAPIPQGLLKSDIGLGNVDNTSDLNKPISTATQAALDDKADLTHVDPTIEYLMNIAGAGNLTGGVLSLTGGVGFSISAGTGFSKTETLPLKKVTWGTITGSCLYNGDNYLYIDYNGNLINASSDQDSMHYIFIGYINTTLSNTVVAGWSNLKNMVLYNWMDALNNFVQDAMGGIVESGLSIAKQDTPDDLKVVLSPGVAWLHMQRLSIAQTSVFNKVFISSDVGITPDTTTTANTVTIGYYNDVTEPAVSALVPMTAGYWKKDLFFVTAEGALYYVYSQAQYATEDDAKIASVPSIPENIAKDVLFSAAIITSTTTTTLDTAIYDIRPIFSRLFERGAAAIPITALSHGDLINLSVDDHPQYHNDTRGDTRYYTKSIANSTFAPMSHTHTKSEVGLSNVDNTSDLDKPISTATQTALNAKANNNIPFITLSAEATTPNERALAGTANEIDLTDGGAGGALAIGLVDNPIIPGTTRVRIPAGTTAERNGSPSVGDLRINTDRGILEGVVNPYGTGLTYSLLHRTMIDRRRFVMWDDFMTGSNAAAGTGIYGETNWSVTGSGTNSNSIVASVQDHPGIFQLGTPSQNAATARLHMGATATSTVLLASQIRHFQFLIRIPTGSQTQVRVLCGAGDDMSSTTLGANSVRFQFDPAVNAAMQFITRSGGVDSTPVNTVTVNPDTWYLCEAFYDGTQWVAVVNETAYTAITTNIPTAPCNFGLTVVNNTNASHFVQLDYASLMSRELGQRW